MYRVDIGNGDDQHLDFAFSQRQFETLEEARSALRQHNGGRLHGKYVPEVGVEGWNLGRQEGCDTAVIVRVAAGAA